MDKQLTSLRELQKQKYLNHKKKEKFELYSKILTDFSKEVISIDLNKPLPSISHEPYEDKKYTILSRCATSPNDVVRGKIFNAGYRKNFRTNQIIIDPPYIPEHHRTNRDPIPNDVL